MRMAHGELATRLVLVQKSLGSSPSGPTKKASTYVEAFLFWKIIQ